jgi:hypothetical protein
MNNTCSWKVLDSIVETLRCLRFGSCEWMCREMLLGFGFESFVGLVSFLGYIGLFELMLEDFPLKQAKFPGVKLNFI